MNHGKGFATCHMCGGYLFDSEGTLLCGDCLLAMREEFGIKIFKDGTVLYRLKPKLWVVCPWKARKTDKRYIEKRRARMKTQD